MKTSIKSVLTVLMLVAAGCDKDPTVEIDRTVATVQVTASATQIEAGQLVQLVAVAKQADGAVIGDVEFTWTVNDTALAAISSTFGNTAAVRGKRAGQVIVEAKAQSKSGSVQVAVTTPVVLNPAPVADSLRPSAATQGSTGTVVRVVGKDFTQSSYVQWNAVAKTTTFVNASELSFVVTPLDIQAAGEANVKVVTPGPGGGISTQLKFTIYGPAASVTLSTPESQLLWPGESMRFIATVKDALGRTLSGVPVNWSVSAAAVARVDSIGNVVALTNGFSQISARVDGAVGQATVQVIDAPTADVIFDALENGVRQLFILTPGTNQRRKILPDGVWATQAAVTRDGSRIAFVGKGANDNLEIFTVNRDGSDLRQLTSNAVVDDQPTWSPDGQRIAFRSRRTASFYSDVWVMNADGSNPVNVTYSDVRIGSTAYDQPTWSPDGQSLIFTVSDEAMTPRASTLIRLRLSDYSRTVLNNDPGTNYYEPAYSPDGTMVAFRFNSAALANQILFMNPENGSFWIFLDYPGPGSNPAWSPDNNWIAFESSPNNSSVTGVYVNMLGTYYRKAIGVGSAAGSPANPVWMTRN
jgi:hypothetical protein